MKNTWQALARSLFFYAGNAIFCKVTFYSIGSNHSILHDMFTTFSSRIAMLPRIMSLFPDQLIRLNKSLEDFGLYKIGGNIMSEITVIIPMYLIMFCAIDPIVYLIYRKTEIH